MKIYGLNKKTKNLWIVYDVVNHSRYFYGAYRTEEKAKEIAKKINGKYFYKGT